MLHAGGLRQLMGVRATELTTELGQLRAAITKAADGPAQQSAALIFWTKVYVAMIAILLIAFLGFVYPIVRPQAGSAPRVQSAPPAPGRSVCSCCEWRRKQASVALSLTTVKL